MKKGDKKEKRHDIVFMVKKNVYLHKYKEPFVLKNLDDAMALIDTVINKRKSSKKKKLYACYIKNGVGKLVLPEQNEKYYQYAASISLTEKEMYEYRERKDSIAPAIVDVLQGLWWSIINKKGVYTDEQGKVLTDEK